MEINFNQLIMLGISTGIGSCFGTVGTFLVMRYFPSFWEKIEFTVKRSFKPNEPIATKQHKENPYG